GPRGHRARGNLQGSYLFRNPICDRMFCAPGTIASSRCKRMVSVNRARSFLASCTVLAICCAALSVARSVFAGARGQESESNSKAIAITLDYLSGAVPGMGSWEAVCDVRD